MRRVLVTTLFFTTLGVIAAGVIWQRTQNPNEGLIPLPDVSLEGLVETIVESPEVLAPGPLLLGETNELGQLTIAGIVAETNAARRLEGLPALTGNATLGEVAKGKADDILARQYFEHISPDGLGPSDLVDKTSYAYVRVGENLALGGFTSDAHVVNEWMNSPGHRENILHEGFSEIGIGISYGTYNEQEVIVAVQTFALPLSACPTPDPTLQANVDAKMEQLDSMAVSNSDSSAELSVLKGELSELDEEISALTSSGNSLINQGNAAVEAGNKVLAEQGDEAAAQQLWQQGESLQAEGQAKLAQADAKQSDRAALAAKVEQSRSNQNSGADNYNALSDEVNTLVKELNEQIRAFNNCIEST